MITPNRSWWPGAWLALAALSTCGCAAPEPETCPDGRVGGPREAPEWSRPRPKRLPAEAAAGERGGAE
ncbi:MAG: hypothetical protein KF878_32985 [Planctomycetes bacterium]|nr:hypothetical protein [Planctomycetota bacterium]